LRAQLSFNAKRWFGKTKMVRMEVARTYEKSLKEIAQDLYKRSQANLKGPHYQPGKEPNYAGHYPVPRVTGTLARSLKYSRIFPHLWAVFADSKIANYAKFIHDGTKKMRPRQFIGDVVSERKGIYFKKLRNNIIKAIRKAGR